MNEENNNNVGNSSILKPPTEKPIEVPSEPVFTENPEPIPVDGNDLMAPAPPLEAPAENKFVGSFGDDEIIEESGNEFLPKTDGGLLGETYSDNNANITLEQIRSETEEKKLSTSSLQTKVKKKKKGGLALLYVVIIFIVAIGAILFFYLNSNEPLEPGLPQGDTPSIDIFPEE